MTYDEYDALPGIRSSDLKRMKDSPLHYHTQPEDDDTASRGMLRAIHCLVLEPWMFDEEFAIFYGRRAGKLWDECVLANRPKGATILSAKEHDIARAVSSAVLNHGVAGPFFEPGPAAASEVTITWDHPGTGLGCKARLDRVALDDDCRPCILDLKSYGTTNGRAVGSRAAKLGAHVQLAHYVEGAAEGLGIEDVRCMIVSVETKPPYDVAVFEAERDWALADGIAARRVLMDRIAECTKSGVWPGRYDTIQKLLLPAWAEEDHE
jgi:hypothetical protein